MNSLGLFPFDRGGFDSDAVAAVTAMADGLARTVCIARVLVANGRTVDLAGLDRGARLLCAKALDLPSEAGRSVRPQLLALMREVEQLTEVLQTQPAA